MKLIFIYFIAGATLKKWKEIVGRFQEKLHRKSRTMLVIFYYFYKLYYFFYFLQFLLNFIEKIQFLYFPSIFPYFFGERAILILYRSG